MAVLGNTEITPIFGNTFYKVPLPIAASQTFKAGDPVYMNSGALTRRVAASSSISSSTQIIGWAAQDAQKTLNGSATSLAAGILVDVIMCARNVVWTLPSYGSAPAASNLASSTNGTGFVVYNDAGIYKLDISTTTNPSVRPFAFDLTDILAASGNRAYKATPVVGDRLIATVLDAAKQVVF